MTDSNQTKNGRCIILTLRHIGGFHDRQKVPIIKNFARRPAPKFFYLILSGTPQSVLCENMRDGASWGRAFFEDFVKKFQKKIHKNCSAGVTIGQFRKLFCVGGQPTKSVILGQRTEKSVIDGLHPSYV